MNNLYRQDISISELIEIIFEAWKDCHTFISISQDIYNNIELKPEYLVTVKIADRITKSIIETSNSIFSLKLEEKTNDVFKRCYKDLSRDFSKRISYKIRNNRLESKDRKGRFDITIYLKDNFSKIDSYRTYCVIEVKNFETSYKVIKRDFVRIKELINSPGVPSSFKYGILTFSLKLSKRNIINALTNDNLDQAIDEAIINKLQIIKTKLAIDDNNTCIKIKSIQNKICDEEMGLSYVFLIVFVIIKNINFDNDT